MRPALVKDQVLHLPCRILLSKIHILNHVACCSCRVQLSWQDRGWNPSKSLNDTWQDLGVRLSVECMSIWAVQKTDYCPEVPVNWWAHERPRTVSCLKEEARQTDEHIKQKLNMIDRCLTHIDELRWYNIGNTFTSRHVCQRCATLIIIYEAGK